MGRATQAIVTVTPAAMRLAQGQGYIRVNIRVNTRGKTHGKARGKNHDEAHGKDYGKLERSGRTAYHVS